MPSRFSVTTGGGPYDRPVPKRRVIGSSPAQLVVGSFVTLIAVGTALLWLPIAADGRGHVGAEDALFTATSAATVTGLTTVDVTRFSLFGEIVILLLIQVGGFGIMTIGSVLALAASRRIGLRQRMLARAEIGAVDMGELRRLILAIARITLVLEGGLAVVLFVRFWQTDVESRPVAAAYSGLFHAVSAFNNAGISLYPDNLERFVGDAVVVASVSLAFIVGGLGFPILVELRRRSFARTAGTRQHHWTLHTRITVLATLALLLFGPLVVTAFEWTNPGTLGPLDTFDKLLAGWFQGVTPRTAGFNTIDIGAMNESTLLVITTLMFIGAGPASTSGGIKVTTFAVLGLALWSEMRGSADVDVFGRRLPDPVVRQALTLALLSVALVVGTSLLLMSVDDLVLSAALFEATSAFGTVGLSTGVTGTIGATGHLVLVVVMLAGRVGPITFVTALALRRRTSTFRYPEERPIIG
jgi:potassium uptake TrkH family protein